MNEERIIEIETKLTHQEDLLAQLNDALTNQEAQLNELEHRWRMLHDRIESLAADADSDPTADEPPHY